MNNVYTLDSSMNIEHELNEKTYDLLIDNLFSQVNIDDSAGKVLVLRRRIYDNISSYIYVITALIDGDFIGSSLSRVIVGDIADYTLSYNVNVDKYRVIIMNFEECQVVCGCSLKPARRFTRFTVDAKYGTELMSFARPIVYVEALY